LGANAWPLKVCNLFTWTHMGAHMANSLPTSPCQC
jgi:hypothetical protein